MFKFIYNFLNNKSYSEQKFEESEYKIEFNKKRKEIESLLSYLEKENKDVYYTTKARLDLDNLEKIIYDNKEMIEYSFGNLFNEIMKTLDLILAKGLKIKNNIKEDEINSLLEIAKQKLNK